MAQRKDCPPGPPILGGAKLVDTLKTKWGNYPVNIRIGLIAILSGGIYLAFTLPFLLSKYYAIIPPLDYTKLTHYSPLGFILYILGVLGLFGLYLLALRLFAADGEDNAQGRIAKVCMILLCGGLFALILIFSYPQTAIDLFVYAIRTRGWTRYGLLPFSVSPDALPASDPWLGLAGEWMDAASPYGPVWEWFSLAAYHIAGGEYFNHLLVLKIIAALAYLGCAWLVYRILLAMRPRWAVAGCAFFAWNPLMLLESVQNAHNDILMIFFLLVAVWAFMQLTKEVEKRALFSLLFIVAFALSILVKFSTLIVLPFFALGLALRQPGWFRRLLSFGIYTFSVIIIVVLVMWPYWPGLDNWAVLDAGQNAGRSLTTLLILALRPLTGTNRAFDLTSGMIYVFLGGIYTWWFLKVVRSQPTTFDGDSDHQPDLAPKVPIRASFMVLFWYVLVGVSTFHAWYLLWFIPLAALLVMEKRTVSASVVFSMTALLIIPYFETVRVWIPYLNQNHLLGHAIGVPLLILPPILALWRPVRILFDLQLS